MGKNYLQKFNNIAPLKGKTITYEKLVENLKFELQKQCGNKTVQVRTILHQWQYKIPNHPFRLPFFFGTAFDAPSPLLLRPLPRPTLRRPL